MIYKKVCEFCGQEFETTSYQKKFCNNPHTMICNYCGKEFSVDKNIHYYNSNKSTACCSHKCSAKLKQSQRTEEEKSKTVEKMRKTMLDRYGVDNISKLDRIIEQKKKTTFKHYGVTSPLQHPDIKKKQEKTNLKRYGVSCTFQSEEVKSKTRKILLERYGAEHISRTEYFKRIRKLNSVKRYGVSHPSKSNIVKDRIKKTNQERRGCDYPFQSYEVKLKSRAIKSIRYGDEYWNNPEKSKKTCLERYGVEYYLQSKDKKEKTVKTSRCKYGTDHPSQSPKVKNKRVETVNERYGVDNPFQSEVVKKKIKKKLINLYGADNLSKIPEFKRKATANARFSKLEQRICNLLETYEIEYIHHFFVKKDNLSHEFDFYIPKYKILLDADGVYFHSYLSDPDGKFVGDQYDPVRISLIPKDHIFILAIEGYEEKHIKQLHDIIKQMDEGIYDYDSDLFKWCRSVGFPYPEYPQKRMKDDWKRLKTKINVDKYVHNCRYGNSIIQNFHRSIYDCKVGSNALAPVEAWEDDTLLKKVIENRLIYKNEVDPSKVLSGFNISKICARVSLFNPVLAAYICRNYLREYNEVFDPFSGFSGRMLGVESSGKHYIGQDLNEKVIKESKQIAEFLRIKSDLSVRNILESEGEYECLLTCPPYSDKEIYNNETDFKSCDEWIDECLKRFKCNRYVFVVDETERYKDHIVETISNSSHFSKAKEYIVII